MTLRDEVRTIVSNQLTASGQSLSEEVLDAIWFGLPEDSMAVATAERRVRWEWWDGKSPVNGVPAEVVSERYDIPGAAYVVYVDGKVVFFQTHDPNRDGMVALDAADPMAPRTFVAELVQSLAREEILTAAQAAVSQVLEQKYLRDGNVVVEEAPQEAADLRVGNRVFPSSARLASLPPERGGRA